MPALVLLAVLTNLTALRRIRHVWRATRQVHHRMTEPGPDGLDPPRYVIFLRGSGNGTIVSA
jgi:hypothetical protein